ncbi:ATP-dependent Clp protease ATP-binding subunit [Candidatus Saccharibacteria bacterium]|nr:ATP-dependent Clp protease ATP-binding subunit [Candidatus Saccharibacteria bacterium]
MIMFDYNHTRARTARFASVLRPQLVRIMLIVCMIAAFVLSGILFWLREPLAWLLLAVAVCVMMLLFWYHLDLKDMFVRHLDSDNINDLLSHQVLSRLDRHPTPQKLAKIVFETPSGIFLAARYGITAQFLDFIVADADENLEAIFEKALEIRHATDSEQITGAILSLALVETHPSCEQLLRRLKLEQSELRGGVVWYNYLHGIVKSLKKPRHTGGFGRDLMFGYTPLLQKFGQNISRSDGVAASVQPSLSSTAEIVDQMIQIFSSGGRQNVALVGAAGTGRSTAVHHFASAILDADRKISSRLKFRQVFKLDAAALIAAAGRRGELEGLVSHILGEAFAAKNIIIWLDEAQLFFEEGVGSVDIANILLPILEAGRLRVIMTMDQQRFLEISTKNSSLANTLNKIVVSPADANDTMRVMQDRVPYLEYQHKVTYTYWALSESYRLSEKYIHDLEMPGRALNLLESAAGFAEEHGFITAESVQRAIEKTYGVKMRASQDDEERYRLLNLETLIHQRMVDQEYAVSAVSDALRRAAAGVRNEKRPIGTFLFLGPTGVGKTELAKALSEVYFHGESQIVRLDLNEFVDAGSVNRLIADGATDPLSLTAQVMKQPFSVVLLDEIEKAHPQVLTTLLQLLDEGILRDVKNREVSFRDAIVIATSNAGANQIRNYIDQGLNLSEIKESLLDELIQNNEFKPEFINRFDEICIFKPLSKEDLLQIVNLILISVNKTLEPQRISVALDDEARAILVERGYDPKLGARPMRRVVQSTVENIVARAVLSGYVSSGTTLHITPEMIRATDMPRE